MTGKGIRMKGWKMQSIRLLLFMTVLSFISLMAVSSAVFTLVYDRYVPYTTVANYGIQAASPSGITLDTSGNIYICGGGSAMSDTFWISKWDPTGQNILWLRKPPNMMGHADGDDDAGDCLVDSDGNVVVIGHAQPCRWYAVYKLDSNGNLLWGWSGEHIGSCTNVAADNNYYYLSCWNDGCCWWGCGTGTTVYKLDKNTGAKVWTKELYDIGAAFLTLDSNGNVYVAGGNLNVWDRTVVYKFDNNGNQIWRVVSPQTGHGWNIPVRTDNQYIYAMTRTNLQGAGGWDALIQKFDLNGNLVQSKTFGTPGDEGIHNMIPVGNNLFFIGTKNGKDAWLVVTDKNLNIIEDVVSPGLPAEGRDGGRDISISGNSVVVLTAYNQYYWSPNFKILKYTYGAGAPQGPNTQLPPGNVPQLYGVYTNDVPITIKGDADPSIGVDYVEYNINGGPWQRVYASSTPYSFIYTMT
ncbi:MAG: hypothetical protein QW112_01845, partial [Candidatus Micrarchaeia archaeon]